MTIILFLVDTSASMNQQTYLGTTLMDIAKGAIENFMKIRARDPAHRLDRYMLLTFEEAPANVKAGWKEPHATFSSELKNLEASGITTLGPALKQAFDLLNVNRMMSGIDTYGQGRCPFYLESVMIVCITDGAKLISQNGSAFSVKSELNLPMSNTVPGHELTKEPFRWDQRLFGLVLKIPAVPPPDTVNSFIPTAEGTQIDVMCDVTGGRSYAISSSRQLQQCLESLVQKVQAGVIIHFEKIGPDPLPTSEESIEIGGIEARRCNTPTNANTQWHNCRKMIYVQRTAQKGYCGHWPIPESFWPESNQQNGQQLPARSAHPTVRFSCTPREPIIVENVPFDKYELEPSPLTQYILDRKQSNVSWQVFVSKSAKYSETGHPFGYLKASSQLNCVNLFIMPYNYPVILPLLDDLIKVHKLKPTPKWQQSFDSYIKSIPVYYAQPIRKVLKALNVNNVMSDSLDNGLSYSVVSYLKKVKNQGKSEFDRQVMSVGQKPPHMKSDGIALQPIHMSLELNKLDVEDFNNLNLKIWDSKILPNKLRNPYDISRTGLLNQVRNMRVNLQRMLSRQAMNYDQDRLHNLPVQQMGNYQEHLKQMTSQLREIESQPVRQHMFGNPFRVNKNLMIDEADEAMPGQSTSNRKRMLDLPLPLTVPAKRKPGPLPKEFINWKASDRRNTASNPLCAHMQIPSPIPEICENGDSDSMLDVIEDENSLIMCESPEEEQVADEKLVNGCIESALTFSEAHRANSQLWMSLVKEVKRPGKKYHLLFEKLNKLEGPIDVKCFFISGVIREALRFKRVILANLIEEFQQKLKSNPD